ncbi:carbohydrate esterase family 3 protein, partial [Melanomma pulvis-pyrius CBS 109.77]
WLRIMPLGASIVYGQNSNPTNGFRKPLRDYLRSKGYKVNMVGSQTSGTMADKQHEGYPGLRIAQIYDKLSASSARDSKPSVYLINAGTNDCQQNDQNMVRTIDHLRNLTTLAWQKSPHATIILSTLLASYNEDKAPVARQLKSEGNRIYLADMNDGFIQQSDMGGDGVHPTNAGYRKMAAVWADALRGAEFLGLLQEPDNTGTSDEDDSVGNTCDKVAGRADGPHRIMNGYGFDDGKYKHASVKLDHFAPKWLYSLGRDTSYVKRYDFAQLVNAGGATNPKAFLDEIVWWDRKPSSLDLWFYYWINNGGGEFEGPLSVPAPFDCPSNDIRWADVSDGISDYICVLEHTHVFVGINAGSKDDTHPTFMTIETDSPDHALPNYTGSQVRIADIDGDGRADYCLINIDGDIRCWRNGGLGYYSEYWQDMGVVLPSQGKAGEKIRLIDINGDGRADWVWVGDKGETAIMTNVRGEGPDKPREGMRPYWLVSESAHVGQSDTGIRDNIKFGRVVVKDVSGRLDYVYLEPRIRDKDIEYTVQVWQNNGSGGSKRRSDANRFGDMTGEGRDDYLQIYSNGEVYMFGNVGTLGQWKDRGIIYDLGDIEDRRFVHIADMNGDGYGDLVVVRRDTGIITIHLNTYDGKGGPITFAAPTQDTRYNCAQQGWVPGLFDLAVRFADINGDGRDDYLCIDQDGRTEAILNLPSGPKPLAQIKASETYDRENLRYADVNGDGLADLLWVEKFTGDVTVWYNKGLRTEADRPNLKGSIVEWSKEGVLYFGQTRGPNEYFMDYDGDGRADLVRVAPYDNTGDVYLNKCPTTGGDD